MIHDPEILILDEPTTGLDPNQIVEIRKLIRELGKEKKDSTAISIAERKKKFIIGRMNLTEEGYQRNTQPPFD